MLLLPLFRAVRTPAWGRGSRPVSRPDPLSFTWCGFLRQLCTFRYTHTRSSSRGEGLASCQPLDPHPWGPRSDVQSSVRRQARSCFTETDGGCCKRDALVRNGGSDSGPQGITRSLVRALANASRHRWPDSASFSGSRFSPPSLSLSFSFFFPPSSVRTHTHTQCESFD